MTQTIRVLAAFFPIVTILLVGIGSLRYFYKAHLHYIQGRIDYATYDILVVIWFQLLWIGVK